MNRNDYEKFCSELRGMFPRFQLRKPELKTQDLDGLLWFNHTFQKDWGNFEEPWFKEMVENYTHMSSSPLEVLPRQALNDIDSASDYLQQIVEYNLMKGELNLKLSDQTINEVSFPYPLPQHVLKKLCWHGITQKKPRMPTLTRKRANGLWWIYCIAELMEDFADLPFGSETYATHEYRDGEDMWAHGKNVVVGIAKYHDSKFPLAPRPRRRSLGV